MTAFQTLPVYVSERSAKNMWQNYAVYPEGVELQARLLFKTFVVPVEDIIEVKVLPSGLFWSLSHWADLGYLFALKLDWADICEHVSLHRKSGLIKYIRFTPDNPAKFVAACQSIVKGDFGQHVIARRSR